MMQVLHCTLDGAIVAALQTHATIFKDRPLLRPACFPAFVSVPGATEMPAHAPLVDIELCTNPTTGHIEVSAVASDCRILSAALGPSAPMCAAIAEHLKSFWGFEGFHRFTFLESIPISALVDGLTLLTVHASSESPSSRDVGAIRADFCQWIEKVAEAAVAGKRFSPLLREPWCVEWERAAPAGEAPSIAYRAIAASSVPTVVPLGTDCATTVACRVSGWRRDGLPFDWIRSTPTSIQLALSWIARHRADLGNAPPLLGETQPVNHVPNTNSYITGVRGSTTHQFDPSTQTLLSNAEASRFQRRLERLGDCLLKAPLLDPSRLLLGCGVVIGRPHASADCLRVDNIAVPDSRAEAASVNVLAAAIAQFWHDVLPPKQTAAKVFVLFAFNFGVGDCAFVRCAGPVSVVVIHRFVGYVDVELSWDTIGHRVATFLPPLVD